MRLLISNDDGIYSPGIRALAEVAREFGEVRIVAPDVEQSAMGHAITISRPLRYHQTPIDGFDAYRVNGTPADCVALGADLWDGVDLVLSGINLGLNLGHNVWHSGTVAAAFERLPAIMARADAQASRINRAVIDLAETVVLAPRIGERFAAIVTDAGEDDARIQLRDVPVAARLPEGGLRPGEEIDVTLVTVDQEARRLSFRR